MLWPGFAGIAWEKLTLDEATYQAAYKLGKH